MAVTNRVGGVDVWPYVDRRRIEGRPPPGMPERRHRETDAIREYEGLTRELRTTLRTLDTMIDVMTTGAAGNRHTRPHGGTKRV